MRNVLLCGAALAISLSFTTVSAQEPINTPLLATDPNFRDLAGIAAVYGGTGFADTTRHGGVMRTGVFYRSSELHLLNDTDWTTISSLNIKLDIDLRSPSQFIPQFDKVPNGATWINVDIFAGNNPSGTPEDMYSDFVAVKAERQAFRRVLLDLARSRDPALYHCEAGKDRTGWTSMLLQHIAGVSSTTIMNDYMASNQYLNFHGVQESYLNAGIDEAHALYGSLDGYLTQGLGLTLADIYVLRAKMVYYQTLPGQNQLVGNAAAGAALLNELQESPLSGNYTAYNYYLQSAIDAGTLGGVETQVGGQVFADSVSYLLREPLWIDWAIEPYATGGDLCIGQKRIWVAGLGDYFAANAPAGSANSTESNGGALVGVTYRIADSASAFLGIGGNWGLVSTAGANAEVNTGLVTFGGRYALATLEAGPYVAVRGDIGWVNYESTLNLGGGLGAARGNTSGGLYSGRADLGDVIQLAPFTITPQAGFRLSNASFGGFSESGSELALNVDGISHTIPSFVADLCVALNARPWHGWVVEPFADVGYELALSNPQIETSGELYSFTISQDSAFDSWYLMKAGLGVTAQRNAFILTCGINSVFGDRVSTGLIPQLSAGYRF